MSKEYIEAFKNLKQELYYSPNQIPDIDKWHETIEQALERLEAIDNANPSEALECLEWLTSSLIGKYNLFYEEVIINEKEYKESIEFIKDDYNIIKQALLKAQENTRSEEILQKYYQEGITLDSVRALKQERDNYKKVLEIIKEKAVDVYVLFDLGLEEYNKYVLKRYGTYYQLTEEEFNLLKEGLE